MNTDSDMQTADHDKGSDSYEAPTITPLGTAQDAVADIFSLSR